LKNLKWFLVCFFMFVSTAKKTLEETFDLSTSSLLKGRFQEEKFVSFEKKSEQANFYSLDICLPSN